MPGGPIDTNFHLHGFEGPASEENVFLSTLGTPMHACEYQIVIPRTQPPGTYVYHPHAHGVAELEVASGLSGAWIVEPDAPVIPRQDQHVVVIRYAMPFAFDNLFAPEEDAFFALAAEREGSLRPSRPVAYDPFDPPPWPATYPMVAGGTTLDATGCNGLGSEPLVTLDGARTPASLTVAAQRTQLLRIVNATSDSPKVLTLRDADGHKAWRPSASCNHRSS